MKKIGKFTWTILDDILPMFYQLSIFGQSRFLMNSHHTLLFMLIHSLDNLVFLKSSFKIVHSRPNISQSFHEQPTTL